MTDPKMAEATDEHWVERARAGDVGAFEELVRRHQRGVYAFCRRLTGDHHQADDVAQEAFVRAYSALGRFRGESLFGTWLRQIALNLARSAMRRRRFEPLGGVDLETLAAPLPAGGQAGRSPADGPDPIRRRRLEEAVRCLPEKQRLTLMLKVYEEMTHAEVARSLGCTVGTVKANLFHALRKLRQALGGHR
jgi:RNA polymerase sigma-70 factor (ECF subfamily)